MVQLSATTEQTHETQLAQLYDVLGFQRVIAHYDVLNTLHETGAWRHAPLNTVFTSPGSIQPCCNLYTCTTNTQISSTAYSQVLNTYVKGDIWHLPQECLNRMHRGQTPAPTSQPGWRREGPMWRTWNNKWCMNPQGSTRRRQTWTTTCATAKKKNTKCNYIFSCLNTHKA